MLGIVDSLADTVFSFAVTGTHNGYASILHDSFHIVEVEVDDAAHSDDFGNALGRNEQCVISLGKSVSDREVGIDLAQFLVVDDQQSVDVFADFFHAVKGLVYFAVAFPAEWNGDNAHGENVHLFGDARYGGCCPRSGTSSHSGRDKHHACTVVEHLFYFFDTFLGGFFSLSGAVAGPQSLVSQL